MRLLSVESPQLKLVEFHNDIPPYTILSHRWEDGELLYTDVKETATRKSGFHKISKALEQSRKDGLQYLWADTCCIDKTNSSELSEAINSMYQWYQNAAVCYAYLSDVDTSQCDLRRSQWFMRGLTLQELVAPRDVLFFSRNWEFLGTKADLEKELSSITGIDRLILRGEMPLTSASIAQRMSWAAMRTTTRTEDLAYCLLGIFDVNMPLIYGEGEKAFIRLQEQIANDSDDHSLFAWIDPTAAAEEERGMLAKHPSHFKSSGDYVACYDPQSTEPYSINKKRLRIELRLSSQNHNMIAILSCVDVRHKDDRMIAVGLKQIERGRGEYRRRNCNRLFWVPCKGELTTIIAPQNKLLSTVDRILRPPDYCFLLSDIQHDMSLRVKLINYAFDETMIDRHDSEMELPARDVMKQHGELALRGSSRQFFGASIPHQIGVKFCFEISRCNILTRRSSGSTRIIVACGMTADLKLGFGAVKVLRDQAAERSFHLVAWDGQASAKVSVYDREGFYYTFEFSPAQLDYSNPFDYYFEPTSDDQPFYNFNLKISSKYDSFKPRRGGLLLPLVVISIAGLAVVLQLIQVVYQVVVTYRTTSQNDISRSE